MWQALMSAHAHHKRRLELRDWTGCASGDAYYHGEGKWSIAFKFGNVHRLMLVIKVSSPPQLHLTCSQVTGRHEQLALCIYSIFVPYPTHRNSPAALYAQTVLSFSSCACHSVQCCSWNDCFTCLSAVAEFSSLTNLLHLWQRHSCSCYFIHFSKSHFLSFLRPKWWVLIICTQIFCMFCCYVWLEK